MDVKINYCLMCGGTGEAEAVQAELERYMGVKAELVDVSKGRFEVVVEGVTIFSKAQEGRFPNPKEIVTLLRKGKSRGR